MRIAAMNMNNFSDLINLIDLNEYLPQYRACRFPKTDACDGSGKYRSPNI
jgi:hypothetical protein